MKAKPGDTVKIHYTGRLSSGDIFVSSKDNPPSVFAIGKASILSIIESSIVGMSPSEVRKVIIPPERAFGPYMESLVFSVKRTSLAPDTKVEVGDFMQVSDGNGGIMLVKVIEVNDEKVVLDANHPLAGEELEFEIELVEIVSPNTPRIIVPE